jgi:hypothetical protein
MNLEERNFDDFINADSNNQAKEKTLEQQFSNERIDWSNKIKSMSDSMKDIFKVSELMIRIYTERQLAVEYYHYLLTVLSKVTIKYRKQFSEKYDYYSWKSQKRFPNEKTKELQILSEISDLVVTRDLLDIHLKFMASTISTIDNLIYGIKYKVEIEQISRGK